MTLEARYRRLMRAFPADWRRRHEDEIVGTLLDAAGPERTRVPFADGADLVRAGLTVRGRALRTTRSGTAGLVLLAACALALTLAVCAGGVSLAFLLTSLAVAVIPGTGVFYTVSSAIGGGWRRGLLAAAGCTLGIVPHIVAAMLGLSGVMQIGAGVFEVIRYAGAAYLVLMGVLLLRSGGDLLAGGDGGTAGGSTWVVIRRGVLLNLLNPKLTLFFFAFLPQFLGSSPHLLDAQLIVLSGLFMLITFAVFALYAYASAALRERVLSAPVATRRLQRVLGSLLVGFGIKLALVDR